jgi:hypothetical protein
MAARSASQVRVSGIPYPSACYLAPEACGTAAKKWRTPELAPRVLVLAEYNKRQILRTRWGKRAHSEDVRYWELTNSLSVIVVKQIRILETG